MKNKLNSLLFILWLALTLAPVPALRAQENQPAPPAPAATDEKVAPPPAAQPPAAPAEEKPAASEAEKTDGQLRELGADDKTAEEKPAVGKKRTKPHWTVGYDSQKHADNERVSFFHDSTLVAGEGADAVVSIFGSSTSAGEVADAVVSVFGSSTSSGAVGDAVVSVVGNTRVTGGTVGGAAVAVFGNTYVNGQVKSGVVAVLGNIELGPEAVVNGEVVCVGGEVIRDAKAVVHGPVQQIAIGGHHFNFAGLQSWFARCFLYARPLAFGEHLLWAWCIALAFLALYALIALIAPGGVNKCVETLEQRPGYSLLSALLTLLLTPIAYLLLVLTLAIAIGFVLIPLFSLGLFFAAIFGKIVILAWLGRRFTKLLGDGPLAQPVFGVLIGGVIVLGLYTIPVVGFIVYKLIGILGLGVVVYTLILQFKASRPAPRPVPVVAAAVAPAAGTAMVEPVPPDSPGLPPVLLAATLPRAGFWIRFAAALLDFLMVAIVVNVVLRAHDGPGLLFLLLAAYSVVMWKNKGTTIGGVICGLKVVRLDDRPLDWTIAIIRALSAFLSFFVAGLGFIWVAFDDDKQSWHDKVAGTTIVRVPKGTPLL